VEPLSSVKDINRSVDIAVLAGVDESIARGVVEHGWHQDADAGTYEWAQEILAGREVARSEIVAWLLQVAEWASDDSEHSEEVRDVAAAVEHADVMFAHVAPSFRDGSWRAACASAKSEHERFHGEPDPEE